MSAIESNINKPVAEKVAESVLDTVIIEQVPKAPRDITKISKPIFVEMPQSFATMIVDKAIASYADPSGSWFRKFIRDVKNPQLHIDLNTVTNHIVKKFVADDNEDDFYTQKQQLMLQVMGSLSKITEMLWSRMTQTSIIETKTVETKDGKERTIIERSTIKPALEHLGWELSDRGIEYSGENKFILHLQKMEGRAAVYNPTPVFKIENTKPTDDDGFTTVRHDKHTSKPDESTNSNYRTVPCKYFTTTGSCNYGDKCTFLHGSSAKFISKPCNFAERCKFKDTTCKFDHTPAETVEEADETVEKPKVTSYATVTKPKPTLGITGKKANAGAGKA